MNMAARSLEQGSWFQGGVKKLSWSHESLTMLLLVALMLVSAFSVVYVKNYERHLFSELQSLQKQRDNLEVEWGQLLLEQSTWATPSRVQHFATEELAMSTPKVSRVIMVEVE